MFSLRGPKLKILAAVLAVISLAAGIYVSFFQSRGFVKTTGTIIDLREDSAGEGSTFYPTVEYTVDGKTYTAELKQGSGSYKLGEAITVMYDPQDPATAVGGRGFGLYFICVGAVILAVVLVSTVREKKSRLQAKELRESRGSRDYAPSVQGEEREVYFLTDMGTPKYGHRIEDGARRVLYEAKMTKFTLTTPYGFDFIDHEHGTVTPHLVGHEEETDWGGGILLDNHYTFELDGVDVWKHLKENGIGAETERMDGSIWPRYRVTRDGAEIATIESSSQYVHEEDAAAHSVMNKIAAPGFYRIWTREEYLDAVFAVAMAFARTGALNDEGGGFGKQIRQSFQSKRG